MAKYGVYVVCGHCTQIHSVHLTLEVDEATPDGTTLADHFGDRPMPAVVAFMRTNKYRCPHTKQLFEANDMEKALLFPVV